jgi:hypothetical protein
MKEREREVIGKRIIELGKGREMPFQNSIV